MESCIDLRCTQHWVSTGPFNHWKKRLNIWKAPPNGNQKCIQHCIKLWPPKKASEGHVKQLVLLGAKNIEKRFQVSFWKSWNHGRQGHQEVHGQRWRSFLATNGSEKNWKGVEEKAETVDLENGQINQDNLINFLFSYMPFVYDIYILSTK